MNIQLPRRQAIASTAMVMLFTVLAAVGAISFVYGFWIFWRPGAFLSGGVILFVLGFFGAIGRTDPEPEPREPW